MGDQLLNTKVAAVDSLTGRQAGAGLIAQVPAHQALQVVIGPVTDPGPDQRIPYKEDASHQGQVYKNELGSSGRLL